MDGRDALDAAKGAIAGAVGVWMMDQVTWVLSARISNRRRDQPR